MNEKDTTKLIALLVAALALLGGGVALRKQPRGILNNNPGNLKRTSIRWRGEVPEAEKTDAVFEQFTAPEWGIRAMARQILTNISRGDNTIAKMITRWAPPEENPTAVYIANVSRRTNIGAHEPIDANRDMAALIGAIIRQENGINPYPADLIAQGIRLA